MACEYCHYTKGHHHMCPEADEPVDVYYCYECKEGIHSGDVFYRLGGKIFCESCVDANRDIVDNETDW